MRAGLDSSGYLMPGMADWGMDPPALFFALSVMFIASYVQAVAGFAMGMILIAVLGGVRIVDFPTLAAVVSLLSMLNSGIALLGDVKNVDRRIWFWLGVGQLPGICLGVWLITALYQQQVLLLELCLGLFITLGGLSMMLRPEPQAEPSRSPQTFVVGFLGGTLGGMFAASGPIIGWFGYRQPLPVGTIRATLLASFLFTTSTRTVVVGVQGGLGETVLALAAMGIPLVVLGAWLGRAFPPLLSETALRRGAFVLLILMGCWICFSVLMRAL